MPQYAHALTLLLGDVLATRASVVGGHDETLSAKHGRENFPPSAYFTITCVGVASTALTWVMGNSQGALTVPMATGHPKMSPRCRTLR